MSSFFQKIWGSIHNLSSFAADASYEEDLNRLIQRCKQYKDVNDMITKQAKLYDTSLRDLSSVGRAAGETYVSIANFRSFPSGTSTTESELRSSHAQIPFRNRSMSSLSTVDASDRSTSAGSFYLYRGEERRVLAQLGRAERTAHQVQAVFAERISAPIILEGRQFKERYDELRRLKSLYKRCKRRYLQAQRALAAEKAKRVPSMEAQVKLVSKLDEYEEEFKRVTERLFVHAKALEDDHHYAVMQHVCGFLLHHYNALVSALRSIKNVVSVAERHIPEKIQLERPESFVVELQKSLPSTDVMEVDAGTSGGPNGSKPESSQSSIGIAEEDPELTWKLQRSEELLCVANAESQRWRSLYLQAERKNRALYLENQRLRSALQGKDVSLLGRPTERASASKLEEH
ncbi:hypothetical protein CCYA_CCYA14G3776 [Cyanidiococcus yangmingshanensis]|nr:hypothetical protein CCYA_CCYA14G3776 [Cyanidiococcus yangmingshanensis]